MYHNLFNTCFYEDFRLFIVSSSKGCWNAWPLYSVFLQLSESGLAFFTLGFIWTFVRSIRVHILTIYNGYTSCPLLRDQFFFFGRSLIVGNFIYSKHFGPSVRVTAAGPLRSCAEARAHSLLWNGYICGVWRQTHAAHANYCNSPEQRAGAGARGSGRWMYWTPLWGASSQARGTGAAKRRHTRNILPCVLPSEDCHVY